MIFGKIFLGLPRRSFGLPAGLPRPQITENKRWRRERDSNPRYGFPYSGFQDRLFQPLTHPSAVWKRLAFISLQHLGLFRH